MPIRPENRLRYPANWPAISWTIRWIRALGQCECHGQCGIWHPLPGLRSDRCAALNGYPHPLTGSTVVLTVAHLDHTPENCHPANLRAMCQGCHLRYDRDHHAETRRATLAAQRVQRGELALFEATAAVIPLDSRRTS
ncbi:MAG TPA: hypothetical protein VOB72_04180 [Candidatus Dormibacteraeota bacterium]|nr:hypothetical protein [Candidatus Dormibacteraeota bacterium]